LKNAPSHVEYLHSLLTLRWSQQKSSGAHACKIITWEYFLRLSSPCPEQNSTYVLLIAHAVKTAGVITINFKDLHVRYQKSKIK